MKKIQLATKLVDFFEEFDHYNFKENMQGDKEDEIYRISSSFFSIDSINQIINQLTNFSLSAKEENKKEYQKLEEIINDLQDYKERNSLDVLVLEPNKVPYHKTIINDYESIEREINANVSVYSYRDNYSLYYDDNGFEKGLEENRVINDNLIVGKFLIIAHNENGRISLTKKEIQDLSYELKNYIKEKNRDLELGGNKLC